MGVDTIALAHANNTTDEQPPNRRGWFSRATGDNKGSLQMLIDTNSKLMMDNARLEVSVDTLRKSFHSHLKDSQQDSGRDSGNLKLSSCTAQTFESSFTLDKEQDDSSLNISEHSIQDEILTKSFNSIPEKELSSFGTSGDDWIIEDRDIEDINKIARAARERRAARKGAACPSVVLKESTLSKETKISSSQGTAPHLNRQKSKRGDKQLSRSLPDETMLIKGTSKSLFSQAASPCKSAGLLVQFGEVESQRSTKTDASRSKSATEFDDLILSKEHENTSRLWGFSRCHSLVQFSGIGSQSSDCRTQESKLVKEKVGTSFDRGLPCYKSNRSLSKSWTNSPSENLLVEFGETPRAQKARGVSKRWSSLKLER